MRQGAARGALELGALGVVFGDIGTSPLYTVQTVFSPSDPHRVHASSGNVYGVISLIFWAVVLVVTVTYILLVMRADNDGEGGIMALITLIRRHGVTGGTRTRLALAARSGSRRPGGRRRGRSRRLLGAFFVQAGINHFVMPRPYQRIVPPRLKHRAEVLVQVSGVAGDTIAITIGPAQ